MNRIELEKASKGRGKTGKQASFKESINLLNQDQLNKLEDADKPKAEGLRKELIEAVMRKTAKRKGLD